METPKWPNLRELVQYSTSNNENEDSKVEDWFHGLSQEDRSLLLSTLEPYTDRGESLKNMPSVSDILRYTDLENHSVVTVGSDKAEAWLNRLTEEELEQVLEHLDMYHKPGNLKVKASLYFSLREYIFSEKGIILSARERLHVLRQGRTDGVDRLGRIENDITHDKKVVIKGDRSEDLSAKSSVLQGNFTRFSVPKSDYSASPRLVIDNDRSVSVSSIIKGSFDKRAGQANAHNEGAYFFEQQAINAALEAKSKQIDKVNDKKKHVLKIFNTWIDILYDTPNNFVLENAHVIDLFEAYTQEIEVELAEQLKEFLVKHKRTEENYTEESKAIIAKYIFALDVIKDIAENVRKDKYKEIAALLGQLLLKQEAPATSQLCEAA